MQRIFFFLIVLFVPYLSSAEIVFSKKWGEQIPVREKPVTYSSSIVATIETATPIIVLEKTSQKINIGNIEDYWYRIRITATSQEGWVFGAYLFQEGNPQLKEFAQFIASNLYYHLPLQGEVMKGIKENRNKVFTYLKSLPSEKKRFLNYYAYQFFLDKDALAIPLLIEFMNPADEKHNGQDANYQDTWIYLNKILPVFLPSQYEAYKEWWLKANHSGSLTVNDQVLMEIFTQIRKNEDALYRTH